MFVVCRRLLLACAATCALSAGSATPGASLNGMWAGSIDAKGATLMLDLRVRGQLVSGTAERTAGAFEPQRFKVSGRWAQDRLQLRLHFPDGPTPELDVRRTGPERLDGALVWPGGGRQPVTLVRP